MALQIIKTPSLLPKMDSRYSRHASVKVKRDTALGRLLGQKTGSVTVSSSGSPACPVILVVPPRWKQDKQDERMVLQHCYEQILLLARKCRCNAIILPLLTADDPGFPAHIDYKIAVDVIQAFLDECPMDVYLTAFQPTASQLRAEVERFLSQNFFETIPLWEDACFDSDDASYSAPMAAAWDDALPAPMPMLCNCSVDTSALPDREELEAQLRATDAGFSETLLNLIDKSGKKDSEIYNKANVSRQHFSKIRNNPDYRPTKPTAIAFSIALELDMEQTRDLIGRAGYTLTNSSKFDVIIMYFIQRRNYNMFDINATLFEFDQSLLGV